ncbi:MAG: DUF3775 domain-containing protein [Pseudomonadota bacterium]
MDNLSINSEYMQRLIVKLRVIMAREAELMPRAGGNASDDEVSASLQEHPGDLLDEELRKEFEALSNQQLVELVALMWVGRGDFEADEWDEAVALAEERHVGPTSQYLMTHPHVADHIATGLEALGHSHVLQDGTY